MDLGFRFDRSWMIKYLKTFTIVFLLDESSFRHTNITRTKSSLRQNRKVMKVSFERDRRIVY